MPFVKDELIDLSVGGQKFSVQRSVLTAVPDSMLGVMFGGDWDEKNGDTDENGIILKGVRPDLFKILLVNYLEPKAIENKYELEPQPHPIVKGDKAQAYRKLLVDLSMNQAAQVSIGPVFDAEQLAHMHEGYTTASAELYDNDTLACCISRVAGVVTGVYAKREYSVGEEALVRFKIQTPASLIKSFAEAFRLRFGVCFLPDNAGSRILTKNESRKFVEKSNLQLADTYGMKLPPQTVVQLCVEKSGAVLVSVEGENGEITERVGIGRIEKEWGEGKYRFFAGLDLAGLSVCILPPRDTAVITV
eukprot:GDKI01024784.1.p1 GENE.GDKI01024784.1~~GDKI01024784.1.p1  ORF type:complete len:304 (+),score=40.19 GDKI01024784.1:92-1003(+)